MSRSIVTQLHCHTSKSVQFQVLFNKVFLNIASISTNKLISDGLRFEIEILRAFKIVKKNNQQTNNISVIYFEIYFQENSIIKLKRKDDLFAFSASDQNLHKYVFRYRVYFQNLMYNHQRINICFTVSCKNYSISQTIWLYLLY